MPFLARQNPVEPSRLHHWLLRIHTQPAPAAAMLVDYSSSSSSSSSSGGEDSGVAEPAPGIKGPAGKQAGTKTAFALPPPSARNAKRVKNLPLLEDEDRDSQDESLASSSASDQEDNVRAPSPDIPRPPVISVRPLDVDEEEESFSLSSAAPSLGLVSGNDIYRNAAVVPTPTSQIQPHQHLQPRTTTRRRRLNEHNIMLAVQRGDTSVSEDLAQVGIVELSGDFVRNDAARRNNAEDALKTTISAVARGDGRNHIRSLVVKAELQRNKEMSGLQ